MSVEVDDSAIIGYTESYTDTFPENNGETNFDHGLGMPYAGVYTSHAFAAEFNIVEE